MTTAGELNQRITIEERVKTDNTRGEVAYIWTPWSGVPGGKLWAKVVPLRGREFFAAAQSQSEITTRFRIRYRTGILPSMRIVWKGAYYEIKGLPIEVDGGREWLDLMCKAGPQDGR